MCIRSRTCATTQAHGSMNLLVRTAMHTHFVLIVCTVRTRQHDLHVRAAFRLPHGTYEHWRALVGDSSLVPRSHYNIKHTFVLDAASGFIFTEEGVRISRSRYKRFVRTIYYILTREQFYLSCLHSIQHCFSAVRRRYARMHDMFLVSVKLAIRQSMCSVEKRLLLITESEERCRTKAR